MMVLGIDLAAGTKKTYACVVEDRDGALRADVFAGCDDEQLVDLAKGRDKVAIDAPFGWPRAFVEALNAHRRFEAWPAPDDGPPETYRAALSFRATDRVVMHTRRPLSVSTDKLGVPAMRCAHLLHRWSVAGESVDRTGRGRFVEVYPAGALRRWDLDASGYKGSDKAALQALTAAVLGALPALELSVDDEQLCASVDDAFDALVAALVARAALLGLTDLPPRARYEQAAEEGWIHLPLRGSLPLLARSRSELRCAPAAALATRRKELGVAVDAKGYVERFEESVLATFSTALTDAIRAGLSDKGGSELLARGDGPPKFHAAHSSAALAANVFGPWLVGDEAVWFVGETFAGEKHLEAECSTGLRGTPPTLDLLVDGPHVLAVESKCTEVFEAHEAAFKPAYEGLVAELADPIWRAEYDRLIEDPRRYRFLDAAQLVKHYLGLRRRFSDRPVTLAYLYWEPANAPDVAACVVHAAEVAEFALRVDESRVRFVAMSYRALWEDWADDTRPAWLREHVAQLRRRYDVTVAQSVAA